MVRKHVRLYVERRPDGSVTVNKHKAFVGVKITVTVFLSIAYVVGEKKRFREKKSEQNESMNLSLSSDNGQTKQQKHLGAKGQ